MGARVDRERVTEGCPAPTGWTRRPIEPIHSLHGSPMHPTADRIRSHACKRGDGIRGAPLHGRCMLRLWNVLKTTLLGETSPARLWDEIWPRLLTQTPVQPSTMYLKCLAMH